MKVLFNTQSIGFQTMGGLEIQMLQTKKSLEKLGVNVKFFDPFHDILEDFDILHTFGSYSYETVPITKMAKQKNIPIAISPVYWDSSFLRKVFNFEAQFLNIFGQKYLSSLLNPPKYLLSLSDIILPNSDLESQHLINQFHINRKKIFVVPNGVEKRFLHGDPSIFIKKYGIEDFVLFSGRIENRKNVINLIKAMNEIKIPLVIIGDQMYNKNYFDFCKKISSNNIYFLGKLNHDSELLSSAYSAAKVFVLPSWSETPGIAALEAGLAGCNFVISNRGSTTEYFKNFALYCNPSDIQSIRNAIIKAYNNKKSEELKNYILENYSWDIVAEKTLEAYKNIFK